MSVFQFPVIDHLGDLKLYVNLKLSALRSATAGRWQRRAIDRRLRRFCLVFSMKPNHTAIGCHKWLAIDCTRKFKASSKHVLRRWNILGYIEPLTIFALQVDGVFKILRCGSS